MLFEGYIANHAALARELGLPPSAENVDLLGAAFHRWGTAMAARVFGEWAAAIAHKGSLLLTTDALGLVALYYAPSTAGVQFSTALGDLETGRTLDDTAMLHFLAGLDDPGDRSPVAGVRRVRQGHAVIVDRGLHSQRVHDPASVRRLRMNSPAEYEECFRALCTDAVRTALPRRGTVWCELSGGLDSSTVMSIAAAQLCAQVSALSYIFGKTPDADETVWMEAVVKAFNIPWHKLDADSTPAFTSVPGWSRTGPSGSLLTADFLRARSKMLQEHGVGTLLTGMCGDAVLIGDAPEPFYLAEYWDPMRLWSELRAWTCYGDSRPATFWLVRYVLQPKLNRGRFRRSLPLAPWIAVEHREACRTALDATRLPPGLRIGEAYYWNRVLQGALIAREGQDSAHAEFRNPLLFLPLVEFMAAVPWHVKLQPGLDRALQRRAMRGILPEVTRTRRDKRGPGRSIFAGLAASEAWVQLLTDKPAIVDRGYVDGDAWRTAVTLARDGFCSSSRDFLRACMLEAWLSARSSAQERD